MNDEVASFKSIARKIDDVGIDIRLVFQTFDDSIDDVIESW